VELNRLAGESVDVYVNEKLLGKGEIVVVNERLGVRVTEIVTPKEIVQKLG
jgi:flagellar motor switch protein FliN/FliY